MKVGKKLLFLVVSGGLFLGAVSGSLENIKEKQEGFDISNQQGQVASAKQVNVLSTTNFLESDTKVGAETALQDKLINQHLDRLKVENFNKANKNLNVFADLVGEIENSGKTHGSNKVSSAEGLYQFLTKNRGTSNKKNTSLEVAINRTSKYIGVQDWMSQAVKHSSVNPTDNFSGLSREQQKILFFGDLFEKSGSDGLMMGVINGEKESFLKAYYKLHHTNPDQATIKRAERVIGGHFSMSIKKSVGLEKNIGQTPS